MIESELSLPKVDITKLSIFNEELNVCGNYLQKKAGKFFNQNNIFTLIFVNTLILIYSWRFQLTSLNQIIIGKSSTFSRGKWQKRWFYINLDIDDSQNYELTYAYTPDDETSRHQYRLEESNLSVLGGRVDFNTWCWLVISNYIFSFHSIMKFDFLSLKKLQILFRKFISVDAVWWYYHRFANGIRFNWKKLG
jgi:hypothetical protein